MYYLLLAILYPLSLLPLRVLYLLSDLFYAIVFYWVGYRKALVLDNLRHAFPQKNGQELLAIRKQFYHNFCDQWIETIKLLSISEKELNKRITGNWEVFHELYDKEKNTYALLGHTFNWEWANVVCQYNVRQQFVGFYMPATNEAFDKLLIKARTGSGVWLLSMKAKKAMQRLDGIRYILGLIADQNPSALQHAIWLNFMNRETAFFSGPEKLARSAKGAVVFAGIRRVKRGYYNIQLQLLTEDASHTEKGFVMQRYVQFMEQQLHDQPANWLWTHNRWKHKTLREQ